MCPFCYIGKHHFESALRSVDFANEIEVQYKSYQLNPEYHYIPGETVFSMLSKSKGMPEAQVHEMTAHVVEMAKQAGLTIDFQTNIPANTFLAHCLIHFAATQGKGTAMKERLFEAHFVEGKNIEDVNTLVDLAVSVGFDASQAREALSDERYAYEVKQDLQEARQIGIRGVPFFLFDRKYAVSGAQPTAAFVEVLEKSFGEWKSKNASIQHLNEQDGGASCGPDGCSI